MSALADRLHTFLNRFASIGKTDVENIIKSVEQHLAPLYAQARADLLDEIRTLVAEVKVDEQKLAAEIAALLGHTPAPAPAEPPAPQA